MAELSCNVYSLLFVVSRDPPLWISGKAMFVFLSVKFETAYEIVLSISSFMLCWQQVEWEATDRIKDLPMLRWISHELQIETKKKVIKIARTEQQRVNKLKVIDSPIFCNMTFKLS